MAQIVPVILCGGSGTRLWPASRQADPKQFHNMGGNHTLVQETARRALAVSGADNLLSVTHDSLRETLATQIEALGLPARHHILLEPSARNTAAAIAYAALYVEQHFGGGILWVLPSDHVIKDQAALSQALNTAVAAAQTSRLVTFGIRPDRPEPGLGYIRTGAPLSQIPSAHNVEEFVEKPSMAVAVQYVASGKYLWNSGMFVMDAATFLAALRRHAPAIDTATRQAFATATIDQDVCSLEADAYGAIPSAPVDKAVMEKDQGIAVVPCDLGWSDVGSWQSLWD
ncbi:MAG: mannose-1-phosphate guanylyltransferase, partial [Alphaproteobacteria bacterium]